MKVEGHLSGGNWRSKMLKKKVEGELARRILKLVKNGFSLTGKKVCQTAYKFARENGIKGFSMKYEAVGYKWLRNFMKRHKYLKIKKATQISKKQATSPNQASVLQWFEEYITCIIKKYNIVDPRHMWNVDETNVTNIPKEKKFVGLLGKKLNQVVGSERVETSTVVGCANAVGKKIIHPDYTQGCLGSSNMDSECPTILPGSCNKKGYTNDAVFHFWGAKCF